MKIYILLALIVVMVAALSAQYDEKQILMQQAMQHTRQRQFDQAISVYQEILDKFPEDRDAADRLVRSYISVSNFADARRVLDKYKDNFSDLDYMRHNINLLLRTGEKPAAIDEADSFLTKYSGHIQHYRQIASIFEQNRHHDVAIDIYNRARQVSSDDELYSRELASAYENSNMPDKAIEEYLKHLEKSRGFLHFITNRFRNILDEDESKIHTIGAYCEDSENEQLREVYANSLAYIGEHEQALQIFATIDPTRVRVFGDQQLKDGNFEIARRAFEIFHEQSQDPHIVADAKIRIANAYIEAGNLEEAEAVLMEVYNNKQIKSRQYRFRTRANRETREMLADIVLRRNEPIEKAIDYLNEASTFAYNASERKEIQYRVLHLKLATGEYEAGDDMLADLLEDEDPSSNAYKSGTFYQFLLGLLRGDAKTDSLLGEVMISIPENELTNEALQLYVISSELSGNARDKFLQGYRDKLLYRDSLAVQSLIDAFELSGNESVLLLAADWALDAGDYQKAGDLYEHDYTDETSKQYALLRKAIIESDEQRRDIASSFLKDNPSTVFSPQFRKMVTGR